MSIASAVIVLGTAGLLLTTARPVAAQAPATSQGSAWEFRFTSGGFIPAGGQRQALEDAQLSGAQLSWAVRPAVAVTGTFSWARSRDLTANQTPRLDVFTSDLGVEVRPGGWGVQRAVSFSPFVGLGAGVRSYNHRTLDVEATHNLATYGTVGGELGFRRVGLRLEVRDYMAGFKPLVGGGTSTLRNDVVLMAGVRFNRRAVSAK